MKRNIYKKLIEWKNKPDRLPLLLQGARQVGKSYILNEFGNNEFDNCYQIDFEKNENDLIPIFEKSLSPNDIVYNLSLYFEKTINPKSDILIMDEVQHSPKALNSLKYFAEEMPELALCAVGSLLGVMLSEESFPVGKIEFLNLYPMSFEEYLIQNGSDLLINAYYDAIEKKSMPLAAHNKLWELLKEYYVVGGMPKAVSTFYHYQSDKVEGMKKARDIQKDLLKGYINDFHKHSGKTNAMHITSVFNNIPTQLSSYINDSTKRYKFKNVITNKKSYAELEGPIDWLMKTGLAIKVRICHRAQIPFKSFCKSNIFKLYIFDIGLLGCMLELSPQTLIFQDYGITKGFFAENFVACELIANNENLLYSWMERNSEIEFIKDFNGQIVPIEVKSGLRTKAKSLSQFLHKYNSEKAIKISAKNLKLTSKTILQVPLYLSGQIDHII